jgi:uncharacterized protein YggE
LALLSPSFGWAAEETPAITITGSGTVKAKPDEGYITVGVSTVAKKSADAVAENTKVMKALFATLKGKGVGEENIQTLDFSVGENYKQVNEKGEDGRLYPKNVKDGYIVNNSVQVTVCELDKFGDILDAVTANGANTIHGIRFGSSKSADHLKEARKKAVVEATERAKTIADALGVKLGKVLSATEAVAPRQRESFYESRDVAPASMAVPISGGSLSFSVNVNIRWELVDPNK